MEKCPSCGCQRYTRRESQFEEGPLEMAPDDGGRTIYVRVVKETVNVCCAKCGCVIRTETHLT